MTIRGRPDERAIQQLLAFNRTDPQPDSYRSGLGVESIEAWAAAGGGLLVGIAEPAFGGDAPLRQAVSGAPVHAPGRRRHVIVECDRLSKRA